MVHQAYGQVIPLSLYKVKLVLQFFVVNELRRFVPSVTASDISRGPAGVRAQAMNVDGDLIGEFIFDSPPEVKKLI